MRTAGMFLFIIMVIGGFGVSIWLGLVFSVVALWFSKRAHAHPGDEAAFVTTLMVLAGTGIVVSCLMELWTLLTEVA